MNSDLTGEALPVEKSAEGLANPTQDPLEMPNICFLGSNVEVGLATAAVVVTGGSTYLGSLATSLAGMLSMIVTVNLSKGAISLSRKKIIVKQ